MAGFELDHLHGILLQLSLARREFDVHFQRILSYFKSQHVKYVICPSNKPFVVKGQDLAAHDPLLANKKITFKLKLIARAESMEQLDATEEMKMNQMMKLLQTLELE
ncbi:unnamed protein product [Albugo candida]|uniref:Uncharacterized protein n=1 Tax=Albugo candida TaxID=65357 RepID=A0A024FYG5_9STRA|nr:unnamed protein product [Albugo candida]|eukprot:CCI11714.1 unnamed protein product [Albugo candida]